MSTPFFMRKDVMQDVAQLSQFDDELYKVCFVYFRIMIMMRREGNHLFGLFQPLGDWKRERKGRG